MRVDMPIYAGHHYPEFFPEPEQFKPERFLKENEQDIKPYTFRAFGGKLLALLRVHLFERSISNISFFIKEATDSALDKGLLWLR